VGRNSGFIKLYRQPLAQQLTGSRASTHVRGAGRGHRRRAGARRRARGTRGGRGGARGHIASNLEA
jgi:hypothetical protein